jgi:hypothetical protein
VRAFAGDIDADVTLDFGKIQPEEKPHFDRSYVKNGKRFFKSGWFGEFNTPAYGESLVFAMTSRFLGSPLDQCSELQIHLDLFQR